MLKKSISLNSIILGAFAVLTAGILAFIYSSTAERIAEQERQAAQKALLEIIPRAQHDNDLLASRWSIPNALKSQLGLKNPSDIHIATRNNTIIGMIIPALAPDGYSGDIKILVGIYMDGSVSGVRVLSHKETPGLGDKADIKKSDWILSFDGKSLDTPIIEKWEVKKDGGEFDQFTGATITPRAIVKRVRKTLEFFKQHKDLITYQAGLDNNHE